ncbi:MAG: HEAT repeat domain-containing protein [Thermodesulfobacteriota bacterium]
MKDALVFLSAFFVAFLILMISEVWATRRSIDNLEKKNAVSALIRVLRKKKSYQNETGRRRRLEAASALSRIGSAKAIEALVRVMNDKQESQDFHRGVVIALMRAKSQDMVKPLISANKELSQEFETFIINDLIFKLKDRNPSIQQSARRQLIEIGKPSVEPLIATLEKMNYVECPGKPLCASVDNKHVANVRIEIVKVLRSIGGDRAFKALQTLLDDPYYYITEDWDGRRGCKYIVREAVGGLE